MLSATNCIKDTIHTIHDWPYNLVTTDLENNCLREQLFSRTAVRVNSCSHKQLFVNGWAIWILPHTILQNVRVAHAFPSKFSRIKMNKETNSNHMDVEKHLFR